MTQTHRENTGTLQRVQRDALPREDTGTLRNPTVMKWLFLFASLVAFLIIFGGFVRLTRSGLSITEWNPISGTVPPRGEAA